MHISEGVLSGPVLLTGGVLTVAGTASGLKKLDFERIARAGRQFVVRNYSWAHVVERVGTIEDQLTRGRKQAQKQ
jgi:hypothetical protein